MPTEIRVRNVSTGRRPEWVACVREGEDVRTVYLRVPDLIEALARCEYLYPGVKQEVINA